MDKPRGEKGEPKPGHERLNDVDRGVESLLESVREIEREKRLAAPAASSKRRS
jgi:hypothetical protein